MANHPNRSQSRPVCDVTSNGVILGHAANETEALVILRQHFGAGVPIAAASRQDVLLMREHEGRRSIRAWVPASNAP